MRHSKVECSSHKFRSLYCVQERGEMRFGESRDRENEVRELQGPL